MAGHEQAQPRVAMRRRRSAGQLPVQVGRERRRRDRRQAMGIDRELVEQARGGNDVRTVGPGLERSLRGEQRPGLPQRGEVFGPRREPATAEFQQRRQPVTDRSDERLHALGGAAQHGAGRLVMLAGAAQQRILPALEGVVAAQQPLQPQGPQPMAAVRHRQGHVRMRQHLEHRLAAQPRQRRPQREAQQQSGRLRRQRLAMRVVDIETRLPQLRRHARGQATVGNGHGQPRRGAVGLLQPAHDQVGDHARLVFRIAAGSQFQGAARRRGGQWRQHRGQRVQALAQSLRRRRRAHRRRLGIGALRPELPRRATRRPERAAARIGGIPRGREPPRERVRVGPHVDNGRVSRRERGHRRGRGDRIQPREAAGERQFAAGVRPRQRAVRAAGQPVGQLHLRIDVVTGNAGAVEAPGVVQALQLGGHGLGFGLAHGHAPQGLFQVRRQQQHVGKLVASDLVEGAHQFLGQARRGLRRALQPVAGHQLVRQDQRPRAIDGRIGRCREAQRGRSLDRQLRRRQDARQQHGFAPRSLEDELAEGAAGTCRGQEHQRAGVVAMSGARQPRRQLGGDRLEQRLGQGQRDDLRGHGADGLRAGIGIRTGATRGGRARPI
ncbi:MAG: hypothetical protein IPP62_13265 [bacterium]|nr:hypothetical protein [bacterium]